MVSDKFRHQLRQEVEKWQAEGLIDRSQYELLSQRYQFNTLETSARNRFIVIIIGLGSLLLGLAVITFVAANWQYLSREFRVFLLLSVFIGVNISGFYLWRYPTEQWQNRLGRGLLFLGALILGANMALMAQMFHQSGSPAGLYIVWGIGVLAMAYSLRLTLLGILSTLLIAIGYWWGVIELSEIDDFSWLKLVLQNMPLLASLMFIPLAYWCRSRWLFGIGAIAVITSLEVTLTQIQLPGRFLGSLITTIAFVMPPALLWGYDDNFWRFNLTGHSQTKPFQVIARNLALLFLTVLYYLFSFRFMWSTTQPNISGNFSSSNPLLLINVGFLGLITIWEWLNLGRQIDRTTAVVAGSIAIGAITLLFHLNLTPIPEFAVFIFNAVLFILAAGLIREALATGERRGFWSGIILLTLQIASRMLEYDTNLLFKAFVLFLCGVGIIAAGLWFERYLRNFNPEQ
ncbi:DUF2157 domain-containing protein [Aerosakkonemataceae cyanobacterium BLCC-F154]|uniref:DUF2157 domain-containing protein n=1 Tax=Floridaenema fluviatile BLCC-F154 TaxID=3153640 RepID=A0ABV4YDI6_9CYAN